MTVMGEVRCHEGLVGTHQGGQPRAGTQLHRLSSHEPTQTSILKGVITFQSLAKLLRRYQDIAPAAESLPGNTQLPHHHRHKLRTRLRLPKALIVWRCPSH